MVSLHLSIIINHMIHNVVSQHNFIDMPDHLKLPLDNIEVMDDDLMFVLGGAGSLDSSLSGGSGCGCSSGVDCGCDCKGGSGCGCGCSKNQAGYS